MRLPRRYAPVYLYYIASFPAPYTSIIVALGNFQALSSFRNIHVVAGRPEADTLILSHSP